MPPRVAGSTRLMEAPPHEPGEESAAVLPCFDVAIPTEPSRVEHARRITTAWLKQSCRITTDHTEVLQIVISELCTNAIRHGQSKEIGLRGVLRPNGHVRLEVRDWSPSAIPSPQHVELTDESGRGLFLVDVLISELDGTWGFSPDGSLAWFEVPLRSRQPTSGLLPPVQVPVAEASR
jgi:anti-sigma regulatory factor (Ser/Thr protein kinase)